MSSCSWSRTLYVQIRTNEILVRDIEHKSERRVVAEKPFSTQRLLIGEFPEAEATLKRALANTWRESWLRAAPVMLMQPLEKLEGGLAGVERRALIELAMSQGARRAAIVRLGPLLDDAAVLSIAKDMASSGRNGKRIGVP